MDPANRQEPENLHNTQKNEPGLPQKENIKKPFPVNKVALGVLIIFVYFASLYAVLSFQQNKITKLKDQVASQSKEITDLKNQASSKYVEGYRGGNTGVKLKQPVADMAAQTLEIIGIYFNKNKEYPSSESKPMLQLWWDNGYNGASAGGSLKCPDYNGYFSYTGFEDPASDKIETFKLYYCDGGKLVTKTQTDI